MCFSAEVSFVTAAALIPIGGVCLQLARRRLPEFTRFAAVPLAFGLQQFAEGIVWTGLNGGDRQLVQIGTGIYLTFALGFWPLWTAFAALGTESPGWRRALLLGWLLAALSWSAWALIPLFTDVPEQLTAAVCQRSLQYHYTDCLLLVPGLSRRGGELVYLICLIGPLLTMSRWRTMAVPTALIVCSLIMSSWFYSHVFTSVWCFFAAVISAYALYFFLKLPYRDNSRLLSEPADHPFGGDAHA